MNITIKKLLYISACFFVLATSFFGINQAEAQERKGVINYIKEQFLSNTQDSSRKSSVIVVPALGYSQEKGLEYGLAGTYSFYTDKNNPNSRTSNIMASATLTTKKQMNYKLEADVWTKDNLWHLISEIRYRDWPYDFYGIGTNTPSNTKQLISHKLTKISVEAERRVLKNTYLGLNTSFEHNKFNAQEETGGIYDDFDKLDLLGKHGGKFMTFGASALYDNRNRTTYTTSGFYSRIKYAYAPDIWGGENFNGSQLDVDMRYFYSPLKPLTIGTQAIFRSTSGKSTPFYTFQQLGGDMMMRGYYLGRYLDKNYTALQAEARYRFIPRLGAVAFGSLGTVFGKAEDSRVVPAAGLGLRYFYSLEHLGTLRVDFAIGEKRPGEPRQQGFYISINEAF